MYTGQDTAPKRSDPLGTVFGPDDDFVILADIVSLQSRGKLTCGEAHLRVCVFPPAISVVVLQKLNWRFGKLGQ
jgi:hypothetical protein